MNSLLVFSHLRWDFVWQRPQHLMSHLARHYRVLFVEEPLPTEGASYLQTEQVADNVLRVQMFTQVNAPGFHDAQIATMQGLLQQLLEEQQISRCTAWLWTPMALPLLADLHLDAIVYDCMDELSAFRNAPRQLLQRENALLRVADLVFTGGRSLYLAKVGRHPAVHCFPSSVDEAHFRRAREDDEHPLLQSIAHPRLGYCGVIDERLDLGMLGRLAAARPDYQLVMVGPVAKIAEEDLPHAPNIHYLGQQAYADLPRLFAGFDVGLMPFALNEATRFISPTKTLEYMAAGLPIVSTPIRDVVDSYANLVHIGADTGAFVRACDEALQEDRTRMLNRFQHALAAGSWDETARQMQLLIEQARQKNGRRAQAGALLRGAADELGARMASSAGRPPAAART